MSQFCAKSFVQKYMRSIVTTVISPHRLNVFNGVHTAGANGMHTVHTCTNTHTVVCFACIVVSFNIGLYSSTWINFKRLVLGTQWENVQVSGLRCLLRCHCLLDVFLLLYDSLMELPVGSPYSSQWKANKTQLAMLFCSCWTAYQRHIFIQYNDLVLY